MHTNLSPIRRGFASGVVNYKKGALDSQSHVIKLTSCLPMVGGSLRLLPPLKLVAMIQLNIAESGVKHQKSKSINQISIEFYSTEAPFARTIIINNYFYYYDNALRGLINSP